jgi:hypothetical protein
VEKLEYLQEFAHEIKESRKGRLYIPVFLLKRLFLSIIVIILYSVSKYIRLSIILIIQ